MASGTGYDLTPGTVDARDASSRADPPLAAGRPTASPPTAGSAPFDDLAHLVGEWGPDVSAVIDPDGRVVFASRSVERVLGFERAVYLGSPMWDFIHPEDLVAAAGALNEASRSSGYHHPVEFRIRHNDGDWVECEVNGSTLEGPGGTWVILSVRANGERSQVTGRRRRIEQLIRMASLECSAVRWTEVDDLAERFLQDLAQVVGAELVELAWEESDGGLTIGARWPSVTVGSDAGCDAFEPLWPIEESAGLLLQYSAQLDSLPPSELRDRFLRLGTRAVVEVPLSARRPWGVVRLAFGDGYRQWDDVNVDLVTVLVTTLMATLRRCRAEAHLSEQARSDPLTGLMNRAELYHRFEALLDGRQLEGTRSTDAGTMGVLYGDLDLFKEVNDRHGHAAGDRLLVDVADALRSSVRDVDMVARFGGDEFVVVCPQLESPEALDRIMARVMRAVSQLDTQGIPVRMSMGAALAEPGLGADDVVRLADEAMYRAKRSRAQRSPI